MTDPVCQDASIGQFLTQKDRNRHWQSDKIRLMTARVLERNLARVFREITNESYKSRKTQSLLTGSTFWGEGLKGCSVGGWRSGRRRSGNVGGGDTVNVFFVYSVLADYLLCTSRANEIVSGISE